mgnify:CR=1 FL=1|tara:strand:+ start:216 stop:557 length:342 start_codon:yes stop_codon:yes gene_type:complete
MKITNARLKEIIKEELDNILSEKAGNLTGSISQPDPSFNRYNIILNLDGKRILKRRLPSLIQNMADTPEIIARRILKIENTNFGSGFLQSPVTYEMLVNAIRSGDIRTPIDFS